MPASKRGAARHRRRNRRQVEQTIEVGRPLRLVLDAVGRLDTYGGVEDAVAGSTLARARVSEAAEKLAELGASHDAFELIEFIRLHNTMADPETYRETEHEGSAAVIEVAALVLAARGSRAPSSPQRWQSTADGGHLCDSGRSAGHTRSRRRSADV